MSKKNKKTEEEKDLIEEINEEIEEIENKDGEIDEDKLDNSSESNIKDMLAKVTADFENFKKRTQRDREDMIFFLKSDIFKKILPRIDDMERIFKNTPDDMKKNSLYEGVISINKKIISDLKSMGVESFESIGDEVNPDKHDVMTVIPDDENKDKIVDEFEKGYTLNGKILRHAKVVVGN